MNVRRALLPFITGFAVVGLAACNLPISSTPTPFVFPTPNKTMTALFNQPVVIPPTVTVKPPATQPVATATQPPAPEPTATQPIAPISTATQIVVVPTRTTIPTNMRTSPSAVAAFLNKTPDINGPWDDWDTTAYNANNVVFGSANRKNGDDLGASYRVGWDNSFLYVAVKVFDDTFVQNATGEDIFKGDSIEILLDTNVSADFSDESLSSDDYQLGITPGRGTIGTNMEAYLWYPSGKKGNPSGVKIGAVSSPGIWRLEAAIPWTLLGITPADGMHLGFALSVSDNDNPSDNVQQSMVSSTINRDLGDPTSWGDLTLEK